MKKKTIVLLVVITSVFFLAGCGNSNPTAKTKEMQNIELVGQEVISHDTFGYWNTSFTMKNNTDSPVNTICVILNELDKDGNIIGTTYPLDPSIVEPGQTVKVKCTHKDDTGIASVKAVEVHYQKGTQKPSEDIGSENYREFYLQDTEPLPLQ
ncbi:FxLYD domain-containing protein [Eubacterium sp. 1001713B170207_170306_E7]|uniref:FxLYD domain-containing protein n=1 Tax=Eubacterium sp. 1001713B170207_170306_E7 TaxID=2787097 RepID=UPI001897E583|nr:FxLYD domain-containing protein [Eubacterium sp. 1001713B170207_170306_E7]